MRILLHAKLHLSTLPRKMFVLDLIKQGFVVMKIIIHLLLIVIFVEFLQSLVLLALTYMHQKLIITYVSPTFPIQSLMMC